MKFASFARNGHGATWGAAVDGALYDLGPTGAALAPTLKAAVIQGLTADLPESWREAPRVAEDSVSFLPVITDPVKVICIGVNYRSHQQETGRTEQKAPTVFTRFPDTQIGHLAPAIKPSVTEQFDYEGEVALVIGKEAFRVDESEAMDHVAGYGIYNDFTARDWQRITTQWIPGKNFPDTGAFGPYFVPADELGDLADVRLETRVNGEVRQSATLSDLYFSMPELIAYVSTFTRLAPGDVIVTGTPGGVGLFMDPPGLLSEGDVVEVEVTGLGTLRNTVTAGA